MKQLLRFDLRCLGAAVLALATNPLAEVSAQSFGSWNLNNNGNWGTAANWVPNTTVPGGVGSIVSLNNDITANRTITVDGARTVGFLILGDRSSTQSFTVGGSTLTFDFGDLAGGNSFLNKFQGGVDTISAPIHVDETLNLRITTQQVQLTGALEGSGVLTDYGNGRLRLLGNNTASDVSLWLWNRGTNNVNNNAQVELGAVTGNAIGGDIRVGNASFGGNGHAVLQFALGRENLDQVKDTATIRFEGVSGRWGYMKMMGGDETVGRILDVGNGTVIENMENETVDTNSILTISGDDYSFIGAHFRDRNGGTGTGTLGLTKAGLGHLAMQGANIKHTGTTTVTGGILELIDTTAFVSAINNEVGGTVRLTRLANSNMNFDDAITGGGDLEIYAPGGSSGYITLQSGGNVLGELRVLQGGLTVSGSGNSFTGIVIGGSEINQNMDLTLNGSNTISGDVSVTGDFSTTLSLVDILGANPISGNITINQASFRLRNGGSVGTPGQITLAGRAANSGEFIVDNSGTANGDRIGDSTLFLSQGGRFNYNAGGGVNETLGQLTLAEGELHIAHAGSGTLTFANSVVREAGTTLAITRTDIGGAGRVKFGSSPVMDDGIVSGGWATVGNEWATYGANGFAPFTGYTTDQSPTTWLATQNVKVTGSNPAAMPSSKTINSLNITTNNSSQNRTVNLGASNRTLTISSGGILSSLRNHGITNGILTSGGNELVFTVTSNQLQVTSSIQGAGMAVTKGGVGLLIVDGTNTYTGRTYLNNGTVRITRDNNLGTAPAALVTDQLQINGGTLQLANTMTLSANRGVSIGPAGGRIEVGIANNNVYTATIPTITAQGVLEVSVRADDGLGTKSTLNLGAPGGTQTYAGGIKTELYAGTINVLGTNTVGPVYVELGTLNFPGNNTFTGNIRLAGGKVTVGGASNALAGVVNMSEGELALTSSNSFGAEGFSLNLGNGVLSLNETVQKLSGITAGARGEIQNGGDADATVIFDLEREHLFDSTLKDGAGLGVLNVTKTGPGVLRLRSGESSFSGVLRVEEGVVAVSSVDFAGSPSAMGGGGGLFDADRIVLNGGGLRFDLPVPRITDRSFTLGAGPNAGALIATGSNREATVTLGQSFPDFLYVTPAVAFEGSGDRTLTLAGYNAGYNSFNVALGDKSTSEKTSLMKIGAGIWEVSGQNAFTGLTTVQEGTLAVSRDGALGVNVPLTGTTANAGLDSFAGSLTDGTPINFSGTSMPIGIDGTKTYYVVNSDGGNFQISENPASFPIDFDSNGSGLSFSHSAGAGVSLVGGRFELRAVNYATQETMLMNGGQLFSQLGENEWAGPVVVNANTVVNVLEGASIELSGVLSGNRGISQVGEGTVILSGNSATQTTGNWDNGNRFYSVQSGALILDYGSDNTSKLPDQARLSLGGSRRGGTLILSGGSHEEIVGAATINAGENAIYREPGSTAIIRLNLLSRQQGAAIYFDEPEIAKVDNTNVNNILGAWAIIRDPNQNDLDWARNKTNGGDGLVVPFGSGSGSGSYLTNNLATNANSNFTNNVIRPSNTTTYSMRFNGKTVPGDITITLNGALNQNQTGGFLITPKMGTFDAVIGGSGKLYSGNAQQMPDFLINQYNPSGSLVIKNEIMDRPVFVAGAGATLDGANNRRINNLDPALVATLPIGTVLTDPNLPSGATVTGYYSGTAIQISLAHAMDGSPVAPTFTFHTGVEKLGPGPLVLENANTYTGVTFLADGVLSASILADGGLPSSVGASSNAAANLSFNGGTLRYLGDSTSTNRGFTVAESARFEVAHELSALTMTGAASGADRIEVGGPGTLIMAGASTGITHWYVDEGRVEMRMNAANNRFSSSLADLTLAGGAIVVVADPAAARTQQFGGQLTIGEGSSEIRAISAEGGVAGIAVTLQIGGVDEIFPVIRHAGGTVRFVEDPVENGGAANITLALEVLERALILPYATYEDTSNLSQRGVNNFATTDISNNAVVSADLLSLYDIGTAFNDPNSEWTGRNINPSEGANGSFNGVLNDNRSVGILRYFYPGDSTVQIPSGLTLQIENGGVLVGANVGNNSKQIIGSGVISGGLAAEEGGRDLIWHNYNRATSFLVGAEIGEFTRTLTDAGSIDQGSSVMMVDFSGAAVLPQLQVGMLVSGPGIAPGTKIVAIQSGFFSIVLNQPATSDTTNGTFVFTAGTNFVQTGIGTTALSGANSYSGTTFVHGGVLRLDSANAVPGGIGVTGGTSKITIEGGVIGLNAGDFSRGLGSGVDQVEFKAKGGFAAYGANRVVNFGGANGQVAWGVGGFLPVGSGLLLGAHDSTHKVTITNPLTLGYGRQIVTAQNGQGAVDGELSGVVSGTAELVKRGFGELRLSGNNTFSGGVSLEQGTVIGANSPNAFGLGEVKVGVSAFTDDNGKLTLGVEGGTVGNAIHVGAKNPEGNTMLEFGNNGELAGAITLDRQVFFSPVGLATRGSISGAIDGVGGFTVTSTGSIALSNAANNFGTSAGAAGDAIDGALIVRSGNLVVGTTGALGAGVVELGDALPALLTVDRATVGMEMILKGGYFDPVHTGTFTGSGPGAFVEVSNVIDGRTFTRADAGALVLVKDDVENPERNGVYEVIFYDIPVNSPDPQPVNTMNLVRVAEMDSVGELAYGTRVNVTNGIVNGGTSYFLASAPPAMNENAVHFRGDVDNPNVGLLAEVDGVTVVNDIDVNSTIGTGVATVGGSSSLLSGTASFPGNVTLRDLTPTVQELQTLRVHSETNDGLGVAFSGVISEADGGGLATNDVLSLIKTGAGRVTFLGENIYGGSTTISDGALFANNALGSATGTGLVQVEAGGTLAGVGFIGGDVMLAGAVANPANLSPGDPGIAGGIGVLTLSQDLTLGAESAAWFTILADGVSDRVVVATLSADETALFNVLFDPTYTPATGDSFNIVDWAAAPTVGDLDLTDNLVLPTLPAALFWDTSFFNTDGILSLADAILPPAIVTDPTSQAVNPGVNVQLSVVASGSGPFSYQWKKGAAIIPGAVNRTLNLPNVDESDEASYTVVVTNLGGDTTSAEAVLSVNDPIIITDQPDALVRYDGQTATFTVVATGTGPLTYQWQFNQTNLDGEVGDSLTVTASSSTAGAYRVLITNVVGTQPSNAANLALFGPDAAIVQEPISQMIGVGDTLNLSIVAQGDAPLGLQWRRNNATLRGFTAEALSIPNATTARAGAYNCVATNVVGGVKKTATSAVAQVGVVDRRDKNFVLKVGAKVTFSVLAVGNNLTYQWMKDNVDIPGAIAKTLVLSGIQVADSGDYVCRVTRSGETPVLGVSMINGGVNNLRVYDAAPVSALVGALPAGMVSEAYSYQFPVDPSINMTPTSFTAKGLPSGLKMDRITGLITGRPTVWKATDYAVTVTISNLVGKVVVATSINISDLAGTFIGKFAGPVARQDVVNGGLGGFFTMASSKTGAVTGRLYLGAVSYAFRGQLETSLGAPTQASASIDIARRNMSSLNLAFTIDSGVGAITGGTVTDGGEVASFTAWRNPWSRTNPTTIFNGTYMRGTSTLTVASAYHTFALDLQTGSPLIGDPTIPQGTGYGSFSIASTTGNLSVAGKTADGQSIIFSTFVGPNGEVAFFRVLYTAANRGSILGSMMIAAGSPAEENLLTGTATWSRGELAATSRERTYKAGFGAANPVPLSIVGGRYLAPVSPAVILGVNPTVPNNTALAFNSAEVDTAAFSPDINVSVLDKSKLLLPKAGTPENLASTSLAVSSTKGTISGGFKLVDTNPSIPTSKVTRSVRFQGLIVRDITGPHGCGYFLLPKLPAVLGETPTNTIIQSGQMSFDVP